MVAVGVVGGMFTLIVLVFGSLVPAMAAHMLADAGEGFVAWLEAIARRTGYWVGHQGREV